MQDTPEFPQLSARFQTYNENSLVSGAPPITDSTQVQILHQVFERLSQYFSEGEFRATLTLTRKRNIEAQIQNVFGQLDEINRLRSTGQLPTNLEGILNNIQAYLEEIDLRFTIPFQTYILQGRQDTSSVVSTIQQDLDQATRTTGELKAKLEQADLLIGEGVDIEMANYFQRLVNGKTIKQNDELIDLEKPNTTTLMKSYGFAGVILALVFLLGADEIVKLFQGHHGVATLLRLAGPVLLLILLGAALLHNWLNRTRPSGYERAAVVWVVGAVASAVATAVYAGALLFELGSHPGWDNLVPKLVSLLAPAYLIRLCVLNYRANKHLAVQNAHRATVARVIQGYAGRLARTEEQLLADVLKVQGTIYLKAAELIFTPGETGFISRGEGAGTPDNYIDNPLSGINNS